MVHRPTATMSAGSPGKCAITSRQAYWMESQMSSPGWTARPGTEVSYGLSRRLAEASAWPRASKIVTFELCDPLSMASRQGLMTGSRTRLAGARRQREDRARVHDALGVERLLEGGQQVVGAAVFLANPSRAVLADSVVVHHRPAHPQGLGDD